MTINVNPTGVFSDGYEYQSDGTNVTNSDAGIFIPLSELGGHLTAAEADKGDPSADYRKILWGVLEEFYNHSEALESDEKPENMTITRTGLTFIDEDTAQRTYSVTFRLAISDMDVEDEPPA